MNPQRVRFLHFLAAPLLCAVVPAWAAAPPDAGDYQRAAAAVVKREASGPRPGRARNVILFIGDGMGISTITASRILEGQRRGESGEQNHLSFEDFPFSALVRTYSADQQVSDSAPTATAMMTGSHANDGTLSVAPDTPVNSADGGIVARHALPTLLEQAEERGLSTRHRQHRAHHACHSRFNVCAHTQPGLGGGRALTRRDVAGYRRPAHRAAEDG